MFEGIISTRSMNGRQGRFVLLICLVILITAATSAYLGGLLTVPTTAAPKWRGPALSRSSSERSQLATPIFEASNYNGLPSFEFSEKRTTAPSDSRLLRSKSAQLSHTDLQGYQSQSHLHKRNGWSGDPVTSILRTVNKTSSWRHCQMPPGGYKAWKNGVVTLLRPIISRNCSKLMDGDREESRRIEAESKRWKNSRTDEMFLNETKDCFYMRKEFSNNLYNTISEQKFPLAFTFVVNSSPQQVYRLLRLLYRPQHTFCIHYDVKTSTDIRSMFDNIARCFNNVLIASKLEDVIWGYNTIMKAQMNCLRDLHMHRTAQPTSQKWKYVINLCGKELPLASNQELVSRLLALNGSSSVSTSLATANEIRKRIKYRAVLDRKRGRAVTSSIPLGPPPFDIKIFKGSSYNAFSYTFVKFILTDPKVKAIYSFFLDCKNPEEHFYASVYMLPGVPGGFNKDLNAKHKYFSVARAIWCFDGRHCLFGFYCHGQVLRNVCVTNSKDLPSVMKSSMDRHVFHNKYLSELDHTIMDCLEERIVSKNRMEYEQECKL